MRMKFWSVSPSNTAVRSSAYYLAGFAVASTLLFAGLPLRAQDATTQTTNQQTQTQQVGKGTVTDTQKTTVDAQGKETTSATSTFTFRGKKKKEKKPKVEKADKVVASKDTKADEKRLARDHKIDPLAGKDSTLPDKQLYDKAVAQQKSGHFDVARLDLNTLLSTYPDSQYQMRAKLAIADSWYQEGGSAALAQAEQEYTDFITFFPNVPEAAEAQMRIGDIYFKQMDVPDRDYEKGIKAEDGYRTMLKQYPDAPKEILDQARQKLREVQELLATREAELGEFYASHNNWPAAIARYQTVVDTYPEYSHMDDTLIGIGDAYEAEANVIRGQRTCEGTGPQPACLPEGPKAKLLEEYDGKAADAYRKVVIYHYAAPHIEDAKERLVGMNLPVPVPTKEQVAASEALEGSRAQYTMKKRLELLVLRKPDTVNAAGMGNPPLDDPPATTAPQIVKTLQADYVAALNPNLKPAAEKPTVPAGEGAAPSDAAPGAPATAAPPTLSDVPVASDAAGAPSGDVTTMSPADTSSGGSGTGVGVEIVNHNSTAPADMPAATGTADPNYGLKTAAPTNTSAVPAIEKPAAAPDQVNEAAGSAQPPAQQAAPAAKGKRKKNAKTPAVDKADESSSKNKPKKGLDKLNPF
jgi:outer membrane protein assembly factor BamD